MSRRHRKNDIPMGQFLEVGKDLFAFLFLTIMVFSFMLMLNSHSLVAENKEKSQTIKQDRVGKSSFKLLNKKNLGRLIKKDGNIFIAFESYFYSPATDIAQMERDGRIIRKKGKNGTEEHLLYLEEKQESRVLLEEYLRTFKNLSDKGIAVAFSEKL